MFLWSPDESKAITFHTLLDFGRIRVWSELNIRWTFRVFRFMTQGNFLSYFMMPNVRFIATGKEIISVHACTYVYEYKRMVIHIFSD